MPVPKAVLTQMLRVNPRIYQVPYVLTIDKVEPPALVENQPMTISFSFTNMSQLPVSGTINLLGRASAKINQLPAKQTFRSSLTAPAPTAGVGEVELDFFKDPAPAGVEFPPPDAVATIPVQIAARYVMWLDSIRITNTRARHEDSDYACIAASVGGQTATSDTKFLGDLNNGDFRVGLQVGPLDVVPGGSNDLVIALLVVNRGHGKNEDQAVDIFNGISGLTKQALDAIYPAYAGIWKIADELTQGLNALFGVNCDGVVVGDKIVFSGASIAQATASHGVYRETRHYPGTDSGDGCGSNSNYYATFSIQRISNS